jgi:hypothetical protein
MPDFRHLGAGHRRELPDRFFSAEALEGVEILTFKQREPRRDAKTRIHPYEAQSDVPGQITEQLEGESHDVVGRTCCPDAARSLPQFGLFEHGHKRMPDHRNDATQKAAECRQPGPRAAFLIREADSDRLRSGGNFNKFFGHCLLSRVVRKRPHYSLHVVL